jgi:hypothetical protein
MRMAKLRQWSSFLEHSPTLLIAEMEIEFNETRERRTV